MPTLLIGCRVPPDIVLIYVRRIEQPVAPIIGAEATSILDFDARADPASGMIRTAGLPSAGFPIA